MYLYKFQRSFFRRSPGDKCVSHSTLQVIFSTRQKRLLKHAKVPKKPSKCSNAFIFEKRRIITLIPFLIKKKSPIIFNFFWSLAASLWCEIWAAGPDNISLISTLSVMKVLTEYERVALHCWDRTPASFANPQTWQGCEKSAPELLPRGIPGANEHFVRL